MHLTQHQHLHQHTASPARAPLLTPAAARELLALHRTAVLRHDSVGQETLLNLLLRNYLHYNLFDQVSSCEKLHNRLSGGLATRLIRSIGVHRSRHAARIHPSTLHACQSK
jgi:hypothetical protein